MAPVLTYAEWARFKIQRYLREAERHLAAAQDHLDNWRRIAGRAP
jgi:hypothetical protein